MKLLNVNALSAVEAGAVFVLLKNGAKLALTTFSEDFSEMKELVAFTGTAGHILLADNNEILLSVDNNLVLFRDNKYKTVLKAHRAENFFWHACKFHETVMVQEYGLAPTSIYASKDLSSWKEVVSNVEIDRHSKHFHQLVYDPYRDQLIATLGDGNYIRAICSDDGGLKWQSLFEGAWQFLPIVPLRDKIVFGMDSGLANGGVGVYDPIEDYWKFTFLKWVGKDVKLAQMCDLRKLDTGLWLAALGTPQAIVLSKDLKKWYPLHIEGFDEQFNYYMKIVEGKTRVICCTGRNLLIFEKEELAQIRFEAEPVLVNHSAYTERFKGTFSVLKKKLSARDGYVVADAAHLPFRMHA
jgi:hypothetical protein